LAGEVQHLDEKECFVEALKEQQSLASFSLDHEQLTVEPV
jgi:hypothetical protein